MTEQPPMIPVNLFLSVGHHAVQKIWGCQSPLLTKTSWYRLAKAHSRGGFRSDLQLSVKYLAVKYNKCLSQVLKPAWCSALSRRPAQRFPADGSTVRLESAALRSPVSRVHQLPLQTVRYFKSHVQYRLENIPENQVRSYRKCTQQS